MNNLEPIKTGGGGGGGCKVTLNGCQGIGRGQLGDATYKISRL